MSRTSNVATATAASGVALLTLASGQFLMTLDTSVMNVAIATVAEDVGTDVTGIQTAITLYTLVMATLMITGGKVGALIGRKRAFAIGCVIYGAGSFTTAISPSLTVLLIGWSFLEGSAPRSSCPRSSRWSPPTSALRVGRAPTAWSWRRERSRSRSARSSAGSPRLSRR